MSLDPDSKNASELVPDPNKLDFVKVAMGYQSLLIAAMTAASYLFAYNFQKAILMHFGVGPNFVEVNLIEIIKSFTAVTSTTLFVYGTSSIIPVSFLRKFFEVYVIFPGPSIMLTITTALIVFSGFNWISVGCFFGSLIVLFLLHFKELRSIPRGNLRWDELYNSRLEGDDAIRKSMVGTKFVDSLPVFVVLILVLIVLVPNFSELAGKQYAKMKYHHSLIEFENKKFIVVSGFKNGLLTAEIDFVPPKKYSLVGNVKFISSDELSSIEITQLRNQFRRSAKDYNSPSKWTGLYEFWSANFGKLGENQPP